MAKATPKIEIGTMFDKNRSLHIERIQRKSICEERGISEKFKFKQDF